MGRVVLLMTACALAGCVSREPPAESRWAPGKVSSRGERVVFEGADGEVLGKWRLRPSSIKIYGADMAPLGVVRWVDDGEGLRVFGGRLGEPERELVTRTSGGGLSIDGALELERAERGWLVYGHKRALLGALRRGEDGEWVRAHDLSGARAEGADVRAGGASSAHLTGFTLVTGGIEPVHRAVVGVLLEQDGAGGGDG